MLRHIDRIHAGDAEPLLYIQFLADLSTGKRAIASQKVPPRMMNRKWDRISELIDIHEEQRFKDLEKTLLSYRGLPNIVVMGSVCETCMSLSLGATPIQGGMNPIASHKCDFKWAVDTDYLLKDKTAIKRYLEDKIGVYLLRVLQILIPNFACSLRITPETELDHVRNEKNDWELYKVFEKPINDHLKVVDAFIKEGERKEREQVILMESRSPLPFGTYPLALLEDLCKRQNGAISDEDATKILNMLRRNIGFYKVRFSDVDRYFTIEIV